MGEPSDQKRPHEQGSRATRGRYQNMNTLTVEQQERILDLLEDGHSIREVERITGHRRETISLYGKLAGVVPRETQSTQARAA